MFVTCVCGGGTNGPEWGGMCTPGGGTVIPEPGAPVTVAVRMVAGNVTTLLCGCCIISVKNDLRQLQTEFLTAMNY